MSISISRTAIPRSTKRTMLPVFDMMDLCQNFEVMHYKDLLEQSQHFQAYNKSEMTSTYNIIKRRADRARSIAKVVQAICPGDERRSSAL